jgi:hypothetical protein
MLCLKPTVCKDLADELKLYNPFCPLEVPLLQAALDKQVTDDISKKKTAAAKAELTGAVFFSFSANSSYVGIESHGLAMMKLQLAGSRILIAMAPSELVEKGCVSALKDLRAYMQNLTPEMAKELGFQTLRAVEVCPGDSLFLPFGFVYAERSLQVTNIGVRFPLYSLSPISCASWHFLFENLPRTRVVSDLMFNDGFVYGSYVRWKLLCLQVVCFCRV